MMLMLAAALTWTAIDGGRVELRDGPHLVAVYNAAMQSSPKAPAGKERCCYLHPVIAPNGAVVTDDFPEDHYHHRGVFWTWPIVRYEGKRYDMWIELGANTIQRRSSSVKPAGNVLEIVNGWFLDRRELVRERVRITAAARDRLDFDLEFEALAGPIELSGSPDEGGKGYGGFVFRFAPRHGTTIRSDDGVEPKDTNNVPHKWTELAADYAGKPATVRITDDPRNPGAPNGWIIRHYGFLGVNYPGQKTARLESGRPLKLRYTVEMRGE